ncbi:transketolase [Candidatus Protochlamydia phocaeensis]|uniref:transketolase n=1 Tax=Candidatus Protochlamydia phocaeensis TaxID=1414722 RepID=UPI0009AEEF05|nr:transketolase [Candidatus Protochlamydia phocaeensis]
MQQSSMLEKTDLDQLCVNTIRFLSVDAVEKANSGHPGLPLDAAPMAYVLWTRIMHYNPQNPEWYNRDRFILSAGHGSALLYSMLHLTGYNLPLDQIKSFRQWESLTPGHPERGLAPGVEVSTGPLGQGFGNGVGLAIAEAYLAARYNRPGHEIINNYVYSIVSDGDLMEGIASEAASLAGHLKLGRLIYLYDDNEVTLSASTQVTFTEDRAQRFEAYGWQTIKVEDGNDLEAIEDAIRAAQQDKERPSLILVRTQIGFGAPNKQGSFEAHGSPLGKEETKLAKENLKWPVDPPFYIPEEAKQHFHKAIEKGKKAEQDWNERWKAYEKAFPDLAKELKFIIDQKLPPNWNKGIQPFPADAKGMATRVSSGKVLNMIAPNLPALIGGSADLNPSTHTVINKGGTFESPLTDFGDRQGAIEGGWNYAGRNIQFGVREHAMGSILNGMAAYGGLIPYGSTFLTFSDYMRPPIRLASLMDLQVLFIFTHDSIALGEDGPTHQPIEHLASLRAIPHLIVIRPADANETAVAWQVSIELHKKPIALILTRQNVPTLDRTRYASADGLRKGAYVLSEPEQEANFILIATGSEVGLIVNAQQKLAEQKIYARLVSMPSWELFEAQPQEYKDSVLPPALKARLAVEAGVRQGWDRYVGDKGDMIGIDRFGASAPGDVVMKEYGFSVDNVVKRAMEVMHNQKEA